MGLIGFMYPVHLHILCICQSTIYPLFILMVVINDNSNPIENIAVIQTISDIVPFHGKGRKLL